MCIKIRKSINIFLTEHFLDSTVKKDTHDFFVDKIIFFFIF